MKQLRLCVLAVVFGIVGLSVPEIALGASQPTPATATGSLRLCKVAGPGVSAGDSFTFTLTTQTVARTLIVTAGSCATLVVGTRADAQTQGFFANHATAVSALLGSGVTLGVDAAQLSAAHVQAILTATSGKPGSVSASSNAVLTLVQQLLAADLNVLRGVGATPSVLGAMAQANAGIQIAVNGNAISLTTSLTTPQLSSLTDTLSTFNEGKLGGPGNGTASVGIVEGAATNVKVSSITCAPVAACTNVVVGNRSVTASVSTGATTEVLYTNRATVGTLNLCKVAGDGVAAGTVFTFVVTAGAQTPRTVTVAAGDCALVQSIPEGSARVTETVPAAVQVFSIACNPGCDSIDLTNATAELTIVGGATRQLTFTNRSNVGSVRVCKNAGTGIAAGTPFTFQVTVGTQTPTSVTVNAGDCATVQNILDGSNVHIAEQLASSFTVFSIACNPGCVNIDLGAASVDITAARNTEKTVTYTNQSAS